MSSRKPLVVGPAPGPQELAAGDVLLVGTAAAGDKTTGAASTAWVSSYFAALTGATYTGTINAPGGLSFGGDTTNGNINIGGGGAATPYLTFNTNNIKLINDISGQLTIAGLNGSFGKFTGGGGGSSSLVLVGGLSSGVSPTFPTPANGDNSTKGATTAFIAAALGSCSYLNGTLVSGTAGSLPRTDIFTIANTAAWTKDTRATLIQGTLIGGGGGGGAGVVAAASAAASGGSAGGAGYTLDFTALASDFPATIAASSIVVGLAGTPGAASTSATVGATGNPGGGSNLPSLFSASGGGYGTGGVRAGAAPGGVGGGLQGTGALSGGGASAAGSAYPGGGSGGASGVNGAGGGNAPTVLLRGGQGGSAGGGISAAGAAFGGGYANPCWGVQAAYALENQSSANQNGPAQTAPSVAYGPGAGGLGGGSAATGVAGAGSIGSGYGSGGGGGGSAVATYTPGSGGAGTPGLIIITQR